MQHRFSYLMGLLGLIVSATAACSGTDSSPSAADRSPEMTGSGGSGGESSSTTSPGDDCVLGCDTGSGGGDNAKGILEIQPAKAELTVEGDAIPTSGFQVRLKGKDVTASVAWTFERPEIGDIHEGATFKPTGDVGGTGKLTARLNGAEGGALVTVFIKKTISSPAISAAQRAALDNPSASPDPALTIVYPYKETVFPRGVLAPEVQWNGGGGGDVYKLTITEKHYTYVEYLAAPPPSRHLIAQKHWEGVTSSGTGAESDPVLVSLTRMSGAKAFQPVNTTWHIAQGSLKGSVYYWELPDACGAGNTNGRILRIKPDSDQVDEFFKPGNCWGCHTVSRDGKTMMATYDTEFPFPMVTIDLKQNPATLGLITPAKNVRGTFSAFNDKGDKAIISNDASSAPNVMLKIVSTLTGEVLNASAIAAGCGEPAWSPDGKKVAGICNIQGAGWVFDANGGDLTVADIGSDGFTTTNVKTIVPKAGAPGRPAYPSFSPGSEWIAFGRPTMGSRSTGNGDLWMVAPDGTGLKKLAAASSDSKSFNPVFAPLRAGGYSWLVFVSRRDYGNKLVNTNRQQLWITAITDPPTGDDPSHPAFYMRGQEGCGKSENAYYALDPCKEIGEKCGSGVDCCGGTCVKDDKSGEYVCGEAPVAGECAEDGNVCSTDADCCNGPSSRCVDKFCSPPIPK